MSKYTTKKAKLRINLNTQLDKVYFYLKNIRLSQFTLPIAGYPKYYLNYKYKIMILKDQS